MESDLNLIETEHNLTKSCLDKNSFGPSDLNTGPNQTQTGRSVKPMDFNLNPHSVP